MNEPGAMNEDQVHVKNTYIGQPKDPKISRRG